MVFNLPIVTLYRVRILQNPFGFSTKVIPMILLNKASKSWGPQSKGSPATRPFGRERLYITKPNIFGAQTVSNGEKKLKRKAKYISCSIHFFPSMLPVFEIK
jgi:hypothetical protein